MSHVFHVLLKGGVGRKLWPLSRQSRPKQYLQLFSKHSMFEMAVERNAAFSEGLTVVVIQENEILSEENLKKIGVRIFT